MTKRIEADWNTWAFIPTTTLQEAVFLSLDFEPAPQGFNGALVMAYAKAGRTDPIADQREFNRRMKIASANVEELAGRSVAYFRDFHVRNAKVSLAKFGTWAEGIGWGLPDKFPRQTDQPIDATNRDDPAPAQTAPEPVEPASDALAKPTATIDRGWVMKRAALIEKHERQWPTINRDFQDASENGLSKFAKAPGHGDWFEADALIWARQRGKLSETTGQQTPSPATPFGGLTHRIKG